MKDHSEIARGRKFVEDREKAMAFIHREINGTSPPVLRRLYSKVGYRGPPRQLDSSGGAWRCAAPPGSHGGRDRDDAQTGARTRSWESPLTPGPWSGPVRQTEDQMVLCTFRAVGSSHIKSARIQGVSVS